LEATVRIQSQRETFAFHRFAEEDTERNYVPATYGRSGTKVHWAPADKNGNLTSSMPMCGTYCRPGSGYKVRDEVNCPKCLRYKSAAYYDVNLQLQDGTTAHGEADIGSQARQVGEDLARQHGLQLGQPRAGPESLGRSPVDYPVYDDHGTWQGKVLVEHGPDLTGGGPFGPNTPSYAFQ
jgi:hypothetical protein